MILHHPLPIGEPAFTDYDISLNGERIQAYQCRVSAMPFNTTWPGRQRPIEQTELAAFISFDMTTDHEPAYIQVDMPGPFKEAELRPKSKKVHSLGWEANSISFTIFEPGQYTLEVDGYHHALHIFANPVEDYNVDKSNPNVLYFGPGIHRPGKIELMSNQTLFIDAGAVVHTSIKARGQRNVRIIGHGVIDNSEFHRTTYTCFGCPTCLELFECENVEIDGVIFRDACSWTVTAYNSQNIKINNAKTIGMWRYNSDGFDMVNSRNIIISNCFLRNFDDCVVLKGFPPYNRMNVENVLVTGCVVWCDWGRALEIGAETCAEEYRNIVFSDCDIIHNAHMALDVQNSGTALVRGLIFENIRIEYSRHTNEPVYQRTMDMEYPEQTETFLPYAMYAEIHAYYHDLLVPGTDNGVNRDILYRDIRIHLDEGLKTPPSLFKGLGERNTTEGIRVEGLFINGERVVDIAKSGIKVGNFAGDVTLT